MSWPAGAGSGLYKQIVVLSALLSRFAFTACTPDMTHSGNLNVLGNRSAIILGYISDALQDMSIIGGR